MINWNIKYRAVNIALASASVILCAWIFGIWSASSGLPSAQVGKASKTSMKEGRALPAPSYYSVIVEKDLFRPSRQKFVVQPKSKPPVVVVVAPPPPPPKPPPRLNLIGTVLLDNEETAVIEYAGSGQKSSYYKVGDSIEDFVIKEIRENYVVLERSGEILKVVMSASTSAPPPQPQPYLQQQGSPAPAVAQPAARPFVPGPATVTPQSMPVR